MNKTIFTSIGITRQDLLNGDDNQKVSQIFQNWAIILKQKGNGGTFLTCDKKKTKVLYVDETTKNIQ